MTYSIVARDPDTGALGVATATGGPCVGALVPHVMSGVGAIATQGDTNPFYGLDGLQLLPQTPAAEMVQMLTAADPGRGRRQLIAIGATGAPGLFSGDALELASGLRAGENYAIAGNMLAGQDVLDAMAHAFETCSGDLADRLLAAMLAGEATGGDKRGTRSAALLVYSDQAYPDFDCRADYSTQALADLKALVGLGRAGDYAAFLSQRPRRAPRR
jgi:uncharacterized Ntn-hydrolase superfamily protein